MNRFIAIVALSLVPVQWAWAQEDTASSRPTTRDTLRFESNAILESLKTIQLLTIRDQQRLAMISPVLHRAKCSYQEEIDLRHLRAGNYQISLTTEFGIYHRALSVRQMERLAISLKKDMDSNDHNKPE